MRHAVSANYHAGTPSGHRFFSGVVAAVLAKAARATRIGLRDYYLAEAQRLRADFDKPSDLIALGRSIESFLDRAAENDRRIADRGSLLGYWDSRATNARMWERQKPAAPTSFQPVAVR